MLGEILFEEKPNVTEIADYGVKFEDFLVGKQAGHREARFDFHFLNEIRGKLTGKVAGVAAITARADGGPSVADIHGTLKTDDGESILVKAFLYLTFQREGGIYGKGMVYFHTNSSRYSWVNSTIGIVSGGGNPLNGEAAVKVYAWE